MKTKAERKSELQALVDQQAVGPLKKIWYQSTGTPVGVAPQSIVGYTGGHFMRAILDAEFPGDDSTPSDPS